MVNPSELLDLDPELEDILSMWGKEPTIQNVEQFFGAYELSRLASLSQAEPPSLSHSGKISGNESIFPRDQDCHKQGVNLRWTGFRAGFISLDQKGNLF